MGWVSGLAVYVVVWWLVLFMVLPWGNRPIDDADAARGHAAGAPRRPRLWLKAAVTTAIAAAVWAVIYVVVESGWISFRN